MTVPAKIFLRYAIAAYLVAFFGFAHSAAAQIYLARFNSDGSLDTNFGGSGTVIAGSNYGQLNPTDVAIDPTNGKIVVTAQAQTSDPTFIVARFNANGSQDSTFGGGSGIIATDFTSSAAEQSFGVAVTGSGKVLAAGYGTLSSDHVVAIARYKTDGTLDKDYEQDGKVLQSFPGYSSAHAFQIALDANGKSVTAGDATDENGSYVFAERRDSSGNLDMSFNDDGRKVQSDYPGRAYSVAVAPSGRIILGGYKVVSGDPKFLVLQLNAADGGLHSSFTFGHGYVRSVVADSSNRVLVAGYDIDADNNAAYFFTARVNTNGTFDTSFSSDGHDDLNINGISSAADLAIQSDGKIVVVGYQIVNNHSFLVLARYKTNGGLDSTFSGDGMQFFDFLGAVGSSVAIDANGKIVVAATIHPFS